MFFPHYFLIALPPLSLLAATGAYLFARRVTSAARAPCDRLHRRRRAWTCWRPTSRPAFRAASPWAARTRPAAWPP
jgi:hypothetical protein